MDVNSTGRGLRHTGIQILAPHYLAEQATGKLLISQGPACPPAPKGAEAEGPMEVVTSAAGPARGTGSASTWKDTQTLRDGEGVRRTQGRPPMAPAHPSTHPVPWGSRRPPCAGLSQPSPQLHPPPAWRAHLPSPLPAILHGPSQPQLLPEASQDRPHWLWQTSQASSWTHSWTISPRLLCRQAGSHDCSWSMGCWRV